MPSSTRLDARGALHHIIARDIEQKKIFEQDENKKLFLDKIEMIRSLKDMGINPEANQNRKAYDERVLGSGEFVEQILAE